MFATRHAPLLASVVIACTTAIAPAAAQMTTPALSPASVDSFLVLVPIRTAATIQIELAKAAEMKRSAEASLLQAEYQILQVEGRVKTSKAEIDLFKARESQAKNAKDDAARLAAENDKKSAESRKDLLEKRLDLRRTEVDAAKATVKVAEYATKALELEIPLQQRRTDRLMNTAGGQAGAQLDKALATLEKQVLEAQLKQADAAEEAAKRNKQQIERRLELQEAQAKLNSTGS